MRITFLSPLPVLLTGAVLALAQAPGSVLLAPTPLLPPPQPAQPVPISLPSAPAEPGNPSPFSPPVVTRATQDLLRTPPLGPSPGGPAPLRPVSSCCCRSRCWIDADYLLWWMKDGHVPGALLPEGPLPHGLSPGVFTGLTPDGRGFDQGLISGGRVTVGYWLDPDQLLGLEAGGFLLEQSSIGAGLPADAAPLLALATLPPVAADATATLQFKSSSRLGGADVNGLFNLGGNRPLHLQLLAGFRFLDLEESLKLSATAGGSLDPPALAIVSLGDKFKTQTLFCGPQAGIRAGYRHGRLNVDGTLKLAVGDSREIVTVNGLKSVFANAPSAQISDSAPGGIFAQPANMGQQAHDRLAVVPEVQLKVGFDLTPHMHVFAGYTFLYSSSVVRPGDQVDQVVNLSQISGPLIGPTRPLPLFRTTDFWAQGVNLGLQLAW